MGRPQVKLVKNALDVLASIAMVAAGIAILTVYWPRLFPPSKDRVVLPREPILLTDVPTKGSTSASAVLVIYSDFQCPYCGRFGREVLPHLEKTYVETGRLQIAFKHFPLKRIHPIAPAAAELSQCAANSKRFWEVHDALFALPKLATRDQVDGVGRDFGLQPDDVEACAQAGVRRLIQQQLEEGLKLGLTATPTVFVGRREGAGVRLLHHLIGAKPAAEYDALLEKILQK